MSISFADEQMTCVGHWVGRTNKAERNAMFLEFDFSESTLKSHINMHQWLPSDVFSNLFIEKFSQKSLGSCFFSTKKIVVFFLTKKSKKPCRQIVVLFMNNLRFIYLFIIASYLLWVVSAVIDQVQKNNPVESH